MMVQKSWNKLAQTNDGDGSWFTACAQVGSDAILVAGFWDSDGETTALIYNITMDGWVGITPMQRVRLAPAAVSLPGSHNVLVCGGKGAYDDADYLANCEEYEWKSDQWKNSTISLSSGREGFGLFIGQFKE